MPKRIPLPCSAENCGDNYPVCGKTSTYDRRKCRCDSCTKARSEYFRKWYADNDKQSYRAKYVSNRDALLAKQRDYRNANRESLVEKDRRYYVANREKRLEWQRRYSAANREARSQRGELRRARKAVATSVPFTVEQLQQRFAYYGDRCYLRLDGCTGGADQVEHVKPLSKGGAHMLCNLRPACVSCNQRKHDKWPFTYRLEDSA